MLKDIIAKITGKKEEAPKKSAFAEGSLEYTYERLDETTKTMLERNARMLEQIQQMNAAAMQRTKK